MARPQKYVTRSSLRWGASPAGWADPRSGLVIHYDSGNQNLANKPHTACLTYWRNTRRFHTGPSRGWADIGYSFMACPHGYVLEGRGLRKQQAAQPGGNASHYSCTLATGPTDLITPEQINAVRELRQWLMESYGVSGKVLGHRDFTPTSCPGDKAYALVQDGTFEQPPGEITEVSDMLGLRKGSRGEAVGLLQLRIIRAGFGDVLKYPGGPSDGIDEDYGDRTAEGVRLCREYVGSRALPHFGDVMTKHACDQVEAAVTRREIERALKSLPSGGSDGEVDASDLVGKTVISKITEVK